MNIKLPVVSVSLKSFNIAMPSYFKRTAKAEPVVVAKPEPVDVGKSIVAATLAEVEAKASIYRIKSMFSR